MIVIKEVIQKEALDYFQKYWFLWCSFNPR